MNYNWTATLALLGALIPITIVGRYLVFKIPALQTMRELNHETDREKLANDRYRAAVKTSNNMGLRTNLVLFIALVPFCVSLEARPLWRCVLDVVLVLLVFDFSYYLVHRFLFHGKSLRKIHALHHEARTPTYIDALYVDPYETAIGIVLFVFSMPLVAVLTGGPLNAFSMAIATLVFTQQNTINHTFVNLPYFPFKTIDQITSLHAAHHVNMSQGNYGSLTMIWDWMFGTLETPVTRSAP